MNELEAINNAINHLISNHVDSDYATWKPSLAVYQTHTGNCKDAVFLKYHELLKAGFERDRLRVLIVRNNYRKTDHMILSVLINGHWVVLDNLTAMRPELMDYLKYNRVLDANVPIHWEVLPMSTQWDAKISGRRRSLCDITKLHPLSKTTITVFALTREDAVDEIKRAATTYGYEEVTIEHITKHGW